MHRIKRHRVAGLHKPLPRPRDDLRLVGGSWDQAKVARQRARYLQDCERHGGADDNAVRLGARDPSCTLPDFRAKLVSTSVQASLNKRLNECGTSMTKVLINGLDLGHDVPVDRAVDTAHVHVWDPRGLAGRPLAPVSADLLRQLMGPAGVRS